MNTSQKEFYESPTLLVVEVKTTGVICTSGEVDATMAGTFEEFII